MMRVLYDAWDWVYAPGAPTAWRLARLLARLPEGVEPLLALPGQPAWPLPWVGVVAPAPDTPWGRLRWEQWLLPRLARQQGAALLHVFHGPPLWASVPVVREGGLPEAPLAAGLPERLRAAAAWGGAVQAHVLLPSEGLPVDVPPALKGEATAERYVVAYGPWDEDGLATVLQGWSWVAQSLGDEVALWLLGLSPAQEAAVHKWLEVIPWAAQVKPLVPPPWEALSALHHAEALLQVGWQREHAEVLGAALALGVPVVGEEIPPLSALLGPAGYLVPQGDGRALGGALIAVLVEEHLAADLRQRSLSRAKAWPRDGAAQALAALYRRLAGG